MDLATKPWSWVQRANIPTSTYLAGIIDDGNNFIWTFGGRAGSSTHLSAIYRYDFANDQWTVLGSVLPFSGKATATHVRSKNETWIPHTTGIVVFDMVTETIITGAPLSPPSTYLGSGNNQDGRR